MDHPTVGSLICCKGGGGIREAYMFRNYIPRMFNILNANVKRFNFTLKGGYINRGMFSESWILCVYSD
jgi:hypothetical protein